MVAPTSSTTLSPRIVGQIAAIAGRSMVAMVRRQNFDIAISAPVLPAEMQASRGARLDRFDRLPHRRLPAAMAQRLARLVVHPDRDLAMEEFADLGQFGKFGEFGAHQFLAPIDDEADVGAALTATVMSAGMTTAGP